MKNKVSNKSLITITIIILFLAILVTSCGPSKEEISALATINYNSTQAAHAQATLDSVNAMLQKTQAVYDAMVNNLYAAEKTDRTKAINEILKYSNELLANYGFAKQPLLDVMQNDSEQDVRGYAAYALGYLFPQDEEVFQAILTAYDNESAETSQARMVRGLTFFADSNHAPQLKEKFLPLAAGTHSDDYLKNIIQLLVVIGISNNDIAKDQDSNQLFIQIAQNEYSDTVKEKAIWALGAMNFGYILEEQIVDQREIVIQDPQPYTQIINTLIEQVTSNPDPYMQEQSLYLLGFIGNKYPAFQTILLDQMIALLQDETSIEIQGEVASVIEQTTNEDVQNSDQLVDQLIPFLSYKDKKVRYNIAEALGNLGNLKSEEALVDLAQNDSDDFVRKTALQALEKLGGTYVIQTYIDSLQTESNENTRISTLKTLATYAKPGNIQLLIATFSDSLQNDNNIYVRGAAAESLGNLNDPQAIEPLVVGLSDKDGYVHEKTLKALETLSTSLAQPYNFAIALPQMEIILLHDQDDFTRADVIRTLIAFGLAGVEGVEELLITSMQTNQYDWIRANSLEALITSNTLSSLDVITDALFNDPAYEVKNTAADVIFATLGEDAVSIFSEALQQSTDDSAGLTLAGYLSNIGENATNPEKVTLAVNALLEALKNNPDDGVRRNSALSLGRIGQNLEDQALIDKIIAGLNAAKNDESQFVTEIIDKALSMVQ